MRKGLMVLLLACAAVFAAQAQQPMAARANVTAYYDEAAIEKDAYRESPYYQELSGSWKQQSTDSSVIYTRQLDAEKTWKDYRVYLNVRCGRGVRVSLNGKLIGRGEDSRHWNEFLLSGIKYGASNTLVIEALKRPQGALLEDKALQVGLNGEPFLRFKSDPCVADFTLTADYDQATATGTLTLAANVFCGKKKGKYYLDVVLWDAQGHEFDRMGRWVVFNGRNEETVDISRTWTTIEPWSAENPVLYTAVVRLRNEKMEEEELVGSRFGFRHVEVKDGLLQVNGKPVTIKGVTYGIEHTEGYASREQMRRDVVEMKRLNINAVRTSRFSPMEPWFYELCDRYGLYVICDANLLPLSEQHMAVATDQDYIPLFQQRVEHLYGKYKNHTSIIAWSLGNTRDNGVCMTAAYKHLKAMDMTRPVIFSGADHGESTDVIAPSYPDVRSLKQSLAKQGTRPYLMLAAVDSAHFTDFESLWQLVGNYRQLQGGFVDVWPLPYAMQQELKHLYSPFGVSLAKLSPDEGEFIVSNRNDFASFSRYSFEYNIFTNLRSNITGGELPVAIPAGGSDKVSMRIPYVDLRAGEELFIRFNLTTRRGAMQSWQRNGDLAQGAVEIPLPQAQNRPWMIVNDGAPVPDNLGDLEMLRHELLFLGHTDWSVTYADRQVRHPDERTLCIDYMLRYDASDGSTMCDVRSTYTLFSTGDVLIDYTIAPTDRIQSDKLQPALMVWHKGDSITWFGLDREVCFDNNNSGLTGIYTRAADLVTRRQVRWCAHYGHGDGLFLEVLGERCTMTTDGNYIALTPQGNNHLRLHLRPYSQGNPADFTGYDFPRTTTGMLQPPVIGASEPRFSAPLTITLSAPQPCEIRYTLDGSDPTEVSPLYTAPFEIAATTVVRARAYAKDMPPSFIATRRFNYDHIVRTTFSRKPSNPYNAGADTILFDGERGEVEDLSHGWLGFSGAAVNTTVDLAKDIEVEYVVLRYAHAPDTWVFAPQQVMLAISTDGVNYGDTLSCSVPVDPADEAEATPRVVELRVPVNRQGVRSIRLLPQTLGAIPAWHRAKGLKPWLLMDEIEIIEK